GPRPQRGGPAPPGPRPLGPRPGRGRLARRHGGRHPGRRTHGRPQRGTPAARTHVPLSPARGTPIGPGPRAPAATRGPGAMHGDATARRPRFERGRRAVVSSFRGVFVPWCIRAVVPSGLRAVVPAAGQPSDSVVASCPVAFPDGSGRARNGAERDGRAGGGPEAARGLRRAGGAFLR